MTVTKSSQHSGQSGVFTDSTGRKYRLERGKRIPLGTKAEAAHETAKPKLDSHASRIADTHGDKADALKDVDWAAKTQPYAAEVAVKLGVSEQEAHQVLTDAASHAAGSKVIGSGSTGEVVLQGNEAVKESTKNEAKVYAALSGVMGVADGKERNGKIVTPYFKNVVSVDDVPRERRKSLAPVVKKSYPQLVNAVTALSELGYDYNDPLQVGYDDKRNANLFDFSAAEHVGEDKAIDENLGRLSAFLREFGDVGGAEAVTHVNQVRRGVGEIDNPFMKDEPEVKDAAKLPKNADGKPMKYWYFSRNARTIPDVNQTENRNGIKTIVSDKPLSDDIMSQWEITPVVHRYDLKAEKTYKNSVITKSASKNSGKQASGEFKDSAGRRYRLERGKRVPLGESAEGHRARAHKKIDETARASSQFYVDNVSPGRLANADWAELMQPHVEATAKKLGITEPEAHHLLTEAAEKVVGGGKAGSDDAAKEYKELGTKAPAFKAWFGDWESDPANASKVVNDEGEPQETHNINEKGKPQVVYHGTGGSFDEFKTGTKNAWSDALGIDTYFFSKGTSTASTYASQFKDGKIIPAYLDIKNPLEIDANGGEWFDAISEASDKLRTYRTGEEKSFLDAKAEYYAKYAYEAEHEPESIPEEDTAKLEAASKRLTEHILKNPKVYEKAKRHPYGVDGIIVKNVMDSTAAEPDTDESGSYSPFTTVYIPFKPTQIKAVDNEGTFDSKNPSIMKSIE